MQRPLGLTEDNALVILMAAHKLNYTPLEINIKSLPPKTLKNKLQKNLYSIFFFFVQTSSINQSL